jgi:iron uptake system component EfeO
VRATAPRCRPGAALTAALLVGGLALGGCTADDPAPAASASASAGAPAGDAGGSGDADASGGSGGSRDADGSGGTGGTGGAGSAESSAGPVIEVDGVEVGPPGSRTAPIAQAWRDAPLLVQGAAEFTDYVRAQTGELVRATGDLVAAVHAGDVARARALYPGARTPWERIEPLGETSTALETRIDGKPADLAPGEQLAGFHALELALWGTPDPAAALAAAGPVADRLSAAVGELQAHLATVQLDPLVVAATTKALLDESTNGKVTCLEEQWSHTELWDLAANLDGAQVALGSLRPQLIAIDPALLTQVDRRLATLRDRLEVHRRGDGWQLCTELGLADRKALSDGVRALSEPVSELEAVVVPR